MSGKPNSSRISYSTIHPWQHEHRLPKKVDENLPNALSSETALAEENEKREKDYKRQIEILKQKVRQAELKAAVSETKLKALEKQLSHFKDLYEYSIRIFSDQ